MSETERVCSDLAATLDELRGAGFRLDSIYPADDPHSARLSRDGEAVRLTTRPGSSPPGALPPFAPEFLVSRAAGQGGVGRAGMLYRDLIPGRLGGRYIASHITVPEGGPVADWVHYHRVALQLIVVRSGWVRVVYEDQGEPFVMRPGDIVLQPPLIRHRVLESSPGLEVVEIGAPALHETFADHGMELPNGPPRPRSFGGQSFVRHVAAEAPWIPFAGVEAQATKIVAATAGLAEVRIIRPAVGDAVDFDPHPGELVFGFVLEGTARLGSHGDHDLGPADAFVIPPAEGWSLSALSNDLRLLQVATSALDGGAASPL